MTNRFRTPKSDECNVWLAGISRCCDPAAFQSAKGGARWCAECRDRQLAAARQRLKQAAADIKRLSSLRPLAATPADLAEGRSAS